MIGTYPIAFMTQREFEALLEYSSSYPTGTRIGKQWRRQVSERDWLRGEYVEHSDSNKVGIVWHEIVIVPEIPDWS